MEKKRFITQLGIHVIRFNGLRIQEYLLLCTERYFAVLCAREAFLVELKGVVGEFTPSIAIHTNKHLGILKKDKCASTRVDSPKP